MNAKCLTWTPAIEYPGERKRRASADLGGGYRAKIFVGAVAFLALACSAQDAFASHFRYGHVTWRPVDTNGLVEFTVTAAFRNGYGVTAVGQYFNEFIGGSTLLFGDGGGTNANDWHVIALTAGNAVVIARLDPGRTGANVLQHRYNPGGPYDARIDSCCRIGFPTHINNPDGFYIVRTSVSPSFGSIGNSSPVSGMPPIIDFCQNRVNTFLVPGSDPNGNPLSFRLAVGGEPGSPFVQPGPPFAPSALSINPGTGLITWDTSGAALNGSGESLYSCQVVIEDGSTKVAVDFLIRLIPNCTTNNCPEFDYPPTPNNGDTINGLVGQNISFIVQASDPDAGNLVTLNHLGLPAGATFSPAAPANPASRTFSWTPGAGQAGNYVVQFSASDGSCNVFTSVNIVVDDDPVPDAVCQDVFVYADGNCEASVAPEDMDGGSSDLYGDPLTFSADPPGPYVLGTTSVTLTVCDPADQCDTCTLDVVVVDAGPDGVPTILCPADAEITCGDATDTGAATGDDNCDDELDITSSDSSTAASCLADAVQEVITRTWTATDDAGNSTTCDQTITVLRLVQGLIIKQGACPAPMNRTSNGVLPVLLTGDAGFDVTQVDLSSVRLSRADCVGGSVAPNEGPPGPHSDIKDLNHPYTGPGPCSCNANQSSDGIDDLAMKFRVDSLVAALQLNSLAPGTIVPLCLTGTLNDGCSFRACDCVLLVPPGTGSGARAVPGTLTISSTASGAWIDVTPFDYDIEGGGFGNFVRYFANGEAVTLEASAVHDGRSFSHWVVDGVARTSGVLTVDIVIGTSSYAQAVYQSSGTPSSPPRRKEAIVQ